MEQSYLKYYQEPFLSFGVCFSIGFGLCFGIDLPAGGGADRSQIAARGQIASRLQLDLRRLRRQHAIRTPARDVCDRSQRPKQNLLRQPEALQLSQRFC